MYVILTEVRFLLADGQVEMFNLNCKLINFIRHLKQRGGVDVRGACFILFRQRVVLWEPLS